MLLYIDIIWLWTRISSNRKSWQNKLESIMHSERGCTYTRFPCPYGKACCGLFRRALFFLASYSMLPFILQKMWHTHYFLFHRSRKDSLESESSATIIPHELIRTRQLESVHLKFNQESGALIPLCLRWEEFMFSSKVSGIGAMPFRSCFGLLLNLKSLIEYIQRAICPFDVHLWMCAPALAHDMLHAYTNSMKLKLISLQMFFIFL